MSTRVEQGRSADTLFTGAFGGSYLNHFWLVCACTPEDRDAPANLRAQPRDDSPSASLNSRRRPPRDRRSSRSTGTQSPDGFAVNTVTQPPYQPSPESRRERLATRGSPTSPNIRFHRSPPRPSATRFQRKAYRGPGMRAPGIWRCRTECRIPRHRERSSTPTRTARRISWRITSRSIISRASRPAPPTAARNIK